MLIVIKIKVVIEKTDVEAAVGREEAAGNWPSRFGPFIWILGFLCGFTLCFYWTFSCKDTFSTIKSPRSLWRFNKPFLMIWPCGSINPTLWHGHTVDVVETRRLKQIKDRSCTSVNHQQLFPPVWCGPLLCPFLTAVFFAPRLNSLSPLMMFRSIVPCFPASLLGYLSSLRVHPVVFSPLLSDARFPGLWPFLCLFNPVDRALILV